MQENDHTMVIDLAKKCIRLSEPNVTLGFEGDSPRFYLLAIALVAYEMRLMATSDDEMPFVPLARFSDRLWELSRQLSLVFKSHETMAKTVYHAWNRRLTPGPSCKYATSRRLTEEEETAIEDLFETEERKANRRSAFRIHLPAQSIKLLPADEVNTILRPTGAYPFGSPRNLPAPNPSLRNSSQQITESGKAHAPQPEGTVGYGKLVYVKYINLRFRVAGHPPSYRRYNELSKELSQDVYDEALWFVMTTCTHPMGSHTLCTGASGELDLFYAFPRVCFPDLPKESVIKATVEIKDRAFVSVTHKINGFQEVGAAFIQAQAEYFGQDMTLIVDFSSIPNREKIVRRAVGSVRRGSEVVEQLCPSVREESRIYHVAKSSMPPNESVRIDFELNPKGVHFPKA